MGALKLTSRQEQYVKFVAKFWKKVGYGPSEQDIANHFLVSTPSVHSMIKRLCELGALDRDAGVPRSTRPTGHSGVPTRPPPGSWVYSPKN